MSDAPIRPTETAFEFLERCSWPGCKLSRARLTTWLDQVPRQARDGLAARLRSKSNEQHEAAVFELLVHWHLLSRGCSILAYEPQIGNHNPDFLIKTESGIEALVEATIISSKNPKDRTQETHEWSVQCALNEVPRIPYHLLLRFRGPFQHTPKVSRIKSAFTAWTLASGRPPIFVFEEAGAKIEIKAELPMDADYDGPTISVVMPFGNSGFSSASHDIKKKLRRKSQQLSAAEVPAILATKLSIHNDDDFSMTTAMFGSERIHFNIETGEVTGSDREDNAGLLHKGNPRNTALTGLLAYARAEPWSLDDMRVTYWQNPWARYSYDAADLCSKRWIANHELGKLELLGST